LTLSYGFNIATGKLFQSLHYCIR